MPVLGIVITTDSASSLAPLREWLHADRRLTVGEARGLRVPLVIESASVAEEQECLGTLEAHPQVTFIEVAFHDFSDLTDVDADQLVRRRRTGGRSHGST